MAIENWINISGTFKKITDQYINISGTFKKVTEKWVNVSGVWQQVYNSISGVFSSDNFTSQSFKPLNTNHISNSITLTVVNGPIIVSVSGASFTAQSKNGGSFGSADVSYVDGDSIRLRVKTGNSYSTAYVGTASMSGDSANFSVTTVAAP